MLPAILILLLVAFVISRMLRSTDLWWKLVLAITTGLLIGILSNDIIKSQKDSNDVVTALINPLNMDNSLSDMQSLVATVTEGTTNCLSEVAGYQIENEDLFNVLVKVDNQSSLRDSPEIIDTS